MKGNVEVIIVKAKTGEVRTNVLKNLQVNGGINWMSAVLGGGWGDVSATGNSPIQIGLTENTTSPAASDGTLIAELVGNGMSRLTATYSHTANASSFTQSGTWQNTGSTITVAKAGLGSTLTAIPSASVDTHFAITLVSPVAVLDSNDTLTVNWGIFW